MATTKTERIANIGDKIKQLENQRKQLLQQQRASERKARTKRLIERGAILESLIANPEIYTNDEILVLLKKTIGSAFGQTILAELKPTERPCPTSSA